MDIPSNPRGRALRAVACASLSLVLVALAACGGPPPTPLVAPTDTPLPAASFTGGTAHVQLDAPASAAWAGGYCTLGASSAWLAINIGDPNSAEYVGIVVGADPHAAADASPAAGGGTFGGVSATVTWRHAGTRAVLTTDSVSIQLDGSMQAGTFSGKLADGTSASGSFACQ